MDPFTFGIVATGIFGGSLVAFGLLEDVVQINETMVRLVLETCKYGGILYLLKVLYSSFFM
ncbi:hypothetical protein [Mesobacillus zeae]|uniref:Uncharacterized protein n=1 Tax=Mesobacillus zeae TaxID=1917180 RepID=A0A398B6X2_9BACI|nr:hypothetical protein [Mesobacillus zeae]RID85685.1 hypothetical protein D1970_09025 [Mesobacillus zeae]